MNDSTLDKVLYAVLGVFAGSLSAASVVGVVALTLHLFCSGPQGYYIEASSRGYTSSVYQNIKFGTDKLIFTGPNGNAWQVYTMVTTPAPTHVKKLSARETVNL